MIYKKIEYLKNQIFLIELLKDIKFLLYQLNLMDIRNNNHLISSQAFHGWIFFLYLIVP